MNEYADRGARALVLLHEQEMRDFLAVWRRAKAAGVMPSAHDDPDYLSLETILRHVLRAGRGYMIWICEVLGLPDPGIDPAPEVEQVESEADAYLEHLLERWRHPLRSVAPGSLNKAHAKSRWGVDYCIDAMLEHAVMHPARHGFQLQELLTR